MNLSSFVAKGTSKAPRPFPGKYPTRIQIAAWRGIPFRYEGKPVPELLNLIRKQFVFKGRNVHDLNIIELDQNGIVRSLREGMLDDQAPFADIYFPIPRFLIANVSPMPTYVVLNRKLIIENGKPIFANTFWQEHPVLSPIFQRMVKDCARNRIGGGWFTRAHQDLILKLVQEKAFTWHAVPAQKIVKRRRRGTGTDVPAPIGRAAFRGAPPLFVNGPLLNDLATNVLTTTWPPTGNTI